ncbi:MAG TPA: hypothetical protein VD927_07910, partial [Chryseosolibacter sp.]|nr:hypothetical protein [Chryseosolibacter sp.]
MPRTLIACFLLIVICCKCSDHDLTTDTYYEGEKIEGLEFFYPLWMPPTSSTYPKISPDGTKLVFVLPVILESPDPWGIYVYDLATKQISLLAAESFAPDWSPDGKWIVYNTIGKRIFKVRPDGSDLTQLTFSGSKLGPVFNMDGSKIAFRKTLEDAEGSGGIWIISSEGLNEEFIYDQSSVEDWNPIDLNEVIGLRNANTSPIQVVFKIINTSNKIQKRILNPPGSHDNRIVQYSPDGTRLVYANETGIWVMNADGTEAKHILPSYLLGSAYLSNEKKPGLHCYSPSWHPDGRHIIYEHFDVTRSNYNAQGLEVEGKLSFY